jgi:hypothetical protein
VINELDRIVFCTRSGSTKATTSRRTSLEISPALGMPLNLGARTAVPLAVLTLVARASPVTKLDLAALVWARGGAFPISGFETRLKCPRCGARRAVVIFEPPAVRIGSSGFTSYSLAKTRG